MKRISIFILGATTAAIVGGMMTPSAVGPDYESYAIFVGGIPPEYRDWK
jgi:hypothetical protein